MARRIPIHDYVGSATPLAGRAAAGAVRVRVGLSGRAHALPPCQGGTHHPSARFPAENASCSPCTEFLNSITMTPECISSTTSWSLPSLC